MHPEELRKTIADSDKWWAENGGGRCGGVSLVVVRNSPPRGEKIRTPFGYCEIMNCQEIDGKYQTVFRVTRKQAMEFLKKWDKNERELHGQ